MNWSKFVTTLRDYRIELGWTPPELARRAKVNRQTVHNAEARKPVRADTAKLLATAISRGLRIRLLPGEIEGLNIQ